MIATPLQTLLAAAPTVPSPATQGGGMTGIQLILMLVFSASMLLVGWLVWRLVNLQAPVEDDDPAPTRGSGDGHR